MLQDIAPSRLDNSFKYLDITDDDTLMIFDNEGRLLCRYDNDRLIFLTKNDFNTIGSGLAASDDPLHSSDHDNNEGCSPDVSGKRISDTDIVYLFSVDDKRYFLLTGMPSDLLSPIAAENGFEYRTIRQIRSLSGGKELFAAFTAYHLWRWYADNRYCGRCAHPLVPDTKERALKCEKCKNIVYPRINPAVIVGVTKNDSLLITRYARGYAHNALVAGFTEIGETLEETVRREVLEETGIRVKNIRYYKSQPWGMAQDLLAGFYCEADGDDEIRMDESELKTAAWVNRKNIELQPNDISLTNEMMKVFKNGKV